MRAAAIQLNATTDSDRNLATADRLVRDAVSRGAELVLLPEKWALLGSADELRAGAQGLDGPALTWAAATAAELGIDLVAGSLSLHEDGRERLVNASVHFGPDGSRRALYRKLHMFDVEVDGQAYRESDAEEPGDEVVLTDAAGVKVGLSICYDLRFPELYRALAGRGALVLTVPSAFTLATTREHWEILLRARAIENQAFVIAANQIGKHGHGMESGGRSMIVDPWGVVLATATDTECAIVADLDLDRLAGVRERFPSLANRRPSEVYA
ncbi:MAG: carbon-nitrogen hydrolase family protein [Solirubrobacteraceae bacterium]